MSTTRILVAGLLASATALAPAAAFAKDGDIIQRSSCSKNSSAKLKLSEENGRIETEFEVDQNRSGVTWKVTLRRNGATVATTSATTRGRSGSFSVRRVLANGAGADTVVAKAKSPTGEVCTVRATFS
jgi:hypothetical protein